MFVYIRFIKSQDLNIRHMQSLYTHIKQSQKIL